MGVVAAFPVAVLAALAIAIATAFQADTSGGVGPL